ncbi:structural maintenance of chromosome 4 [Nematocida major]|uniref:structural maintenance of chromosome 4 n=1 Tax=Nematocida major TaxID=1912982 RepID=UPI002008BA9C|nr:structural maintenance of chromosome 4 [Nematocida major]KAH9386817.1 structural maintenance of chromosome 4 [Nematocida major]
MEQKERQLYIERIIVDNFKSYKGVHTIGPFGKRFNTVVGPNGSGKSNVIDAILFVLGFKAKKLRHSRAEDLIHSGEPKPSKASVTIEMVDEQGVPLSISRTVAKAGKSTYSVNGAVSAQESITELMKEHNVDLVNNRFMILQGEIESISNMKPKGAGETVGLVEYLEEIIGTNVYIEAIKKAENDARLSTEVADRYRAEYQFVEKEVAYLEPKAEAAKSKIGSHLAAMRKRLEIIEEERKEAADAEEQASAEKAAAEGEIKSARTKKEEMLKGQKEAEAEEEGAKGQFRAAEGVYLHAKGAYEAIDIQNQRAQEMKKIYGAKIEALRSEIETMQEARARQKAKRKESEEERVENEQKIARSLQEREELSAEVAKAEERMQGEEKLQLEAAQKELLGHMKASKAVKDLLREKRKEREVAEEALERIKKEAEEAPLEIERAKEKACAYSPEKHEKALARVGELLKVKEETVIELRKREALLSDVKNEMKTSDITDKLTSHLQSIEGYHGRIKELGSIPDKYTMALSAVAKGSVNNLVVDTTKVAEACLDIIKEKRLGRHTILVLDRIAGVKPSTECNRLLDKVKCKDVYKRCFYHILGDTLVVNNMEAAMKRAFSPDRPKVVTLDGKVIDRSGLMSGGAVRPVALSEKRPKKDVGRELKECQEACREAEEGLATVEAALEKARNRLEKEAAHKSSKEKLSLEIKILTERLRKSQEEMKKVPSLSKAHAKAKKEEAALEKEIEGFRAKEAEMEERVKALQERLDELGGASYKMTKARVEGLDEQIFTLRQRNGQLQKVFKEPVVCPLEKERALEEAVEKCSRLSLVPAEKERACMEEAEKELRGVRIRMDSAAEKRLALQREIDVHRIKEAEAGGALAAAEEKCGLSRAKNVQLQKEKECLGVQKEAILGRLGEHREGISADSHVRDMNPDEVESEMQVYLAYQEKKAQCAREEERLSGREKEERSAKNYLAQLKEERGNKFTSSIRKINQDLKRIYSMLTFGGDAEIEPVDYLDPFSEGVVMSVMPPRKSWKSISHLSGGERTLASLSLIFALHEYHPNSFYVMDEIDAALDYKNVGIVGQFIQEKSKSCQFLVISLRENMYELADVFIGVYRPAETTLTLAVNTAAVRAEAPPATGL